MAKMYCLYFIVACFLTGKILAKIDPDSVNCHKEMIRLGLKKNVTTEEMKKLGLEDMNTTVNPPVDTNFGKDKKKKKKSALNSQLTEESTSNKYVKLFIWDYNKTTRIFSDPSDFCSNTVLNIKNPQREVYQAVENCNEEMYRLGLEDKNTTVDPPKYTTVGNNQIPWTNLMDLYQITEESSPNKYVKKFIFNYYKDTGIFSDPFDFCNNKVLHIKNNENKVAPAVENCHKEMYRLGLEGKVTYVTVNSDDEMVKLDSEEKITTAVYNNYGDDKKSWRNSLSLFQLVEEDTDNIYVKIFIWAYNNNTDLFSDPVDFCNYRLSPILAF